MRVRPSLPVPMLRLADESGWAGHSADQPFLLLCACLKRFTISAVVSLGFVVTEATVGATGSRWMGWTGSRIGATLPREVRCMNGRTRQNTVNSLHQSI